MDVSIFCILKERKFLPFFLTQFLGAFNDNAFKLAMLTLMSYHLTHNQIQSEFYQAIAGVLFIFPFFLFSATAGQLADKYDKAFITCLIKGFELFLMIMGSFAFYWGSIHLMMTTLAGLGVHSTFFGPIKYAMLPEHLPQKNLLGATGLIDASTFIAILLGTIMGTLSVGTSNSVPYAAMFLTVGAAFGGLVVSFFIPPTPSNTENITIDIQIWRATYRLCKQVTEHSGRFLVILILSWFWLLGTVVLTKLPDYVHYVLGANSTVFALFLALFSIGIALGSVVVNLIFQGHINLSMVPWAMLSFSFFAMDLYWVTPLKEEYNASITLISFFTAATHWYICIDLFMLAFSAGLFVVPLYTYLQVMCPSDLRARVIAVNNIYNALFMVLGTLLIIGLLHLGANIPLIFFVISLLNVIVAFFSWIYLNKISSLSSRYDGEQNERC